MSYSCLIIDDEETARRGLAALLAGDPDFKLIGTCKNGMEAIDQIRSFRPDLILLDVQMPGVNGFEVLASIPKPWPQVIFITAHDQFALKAFEVNAVDYLLKPFSDERFTEALDRAKANLKKQAGTPGIHELIRQTKSSLRGSATFAHNDDTSGRLVIRADGSIHLLQPADILFIEAYDYYIKVHVRDRFFLIRETMKGMESRLPEQFLRIHKSYIVNLHQVRRIARADGEYEVELNSGTLLKVSRSYKNELIERIGQA